MGRIKAPFDPVFQYRKPSWTFNIDICIQHKEFTSSLQYGLWVGGYLALSTFIQVTRANSCNGFAINDSTINIILVIIIIIIFIKLATLD